MGAGACLQGAVGFGSNLIASPLLILLDDSFVPAPVVIGSTVLNILVMRREGTASFDPDREHRHRRPDLRRHPRRRGARARVRTRPVVALRRPRADRRGGERRRLASPTRPDEPWPAPGRLPDSWARSRASAARPSPSCTSAPTARRSGPRSAASSSSAGSCPSSCSPSTGKIGTEHLAAIAVVVPASIAGFALSAPLARRLDKGSVRPIVLGLSGLAGRRGADPRAALASRGGHRGRRRPAHRQRPRDPARGAAHRRRPPHLRQPRFDRAAVDRRPRRRRRHRLRPRPAGGNGSGHGRRLRPGQRPALVPQPAHLGGTRQRRRQPHQRQGQRHRHRGHRRPAGRAPSRRRPAALGPAHRHRRADVQVEPRGSQPGRARHRSCAGRSPTPAKAPAGPGLRVVAHGPARAVGSGCRGRRAAALVARARRHRRWARGAGRSPHRAAGGPGGDRGGRRGRHRARPGGGRRSSPRHSAPAGVRLAAAQPRGVRTRRTRSGRGCWRRRPLPSTPPSPPTSGCSSSGAMPSSSTRTRLAPRCRAAPSCCTSPPTPAPSVEPTRYDWASPAASAPSLRALLPLVRTRADASGAADALAEATARRTRQIGRARRDRP